MDATRSVSGVWRGDWRCDITAGDVDLRADEPESVPGGTATGPQPTEFLLAAVSSCFTLALAHTARKRSVEVTTIEVEATGTYDGPSFSAIHVTAQVGCPPEELDRLIAGAERVCYVTNTLRGGVELRFEGIVADPASDS